MGKPPSESAFDILRAGIGLYPKNLVQRLLHRAAFTRERGHSGNKAWVGLQSMYRQLALGMPELQHFASAMYRLVADGVEFQPAARRQVQGLFPHATGKLENAGCRLCREFVALAVGNALHDMRCCRGSGKSLEIARMGYCLPISQPSPRQRGQARRPRNPVPSQFGQSVQSSALGRQMIRPPHGAPFDAGRKHMTVLSSDPV